VEFGDLGLQRESKTGAAEGVGRDADDGCTADGCALDSGGLGCEMETACCAGD